MFPNFLDLKVLQSQHPEYTQMLPAYREIDLLTSGGYKLKSQIKQFLRRRPGEDEELYETRLSKYTYSNPLGSAINKQLAKFSNSDVIISGTESNAEFWQQFRDDVDLSGRSEKNLITEIFRQCLTFKKVFLHIDKPRVAIRPLNRAQEELLNVRPYVVLYPAMQVINWSETKGKPDWVKVYQIIEDTSNPLAPPQTRAIWTFIDKQYIARYSCVVELDSNGNIKNVINSDGSKSITEAEIPLVELVEHGLGSIPIVKVEIPNDLWVCDQAASKSLEHLRTDCSKYDLLTMAYFQRTFKRVQTPDADIDSTYVGDDGEIPTGLQHVLELEKFEWSEPQGHILGHLRESLSQIEGQIRDMISLGLGSATSEKGVLQQSGLSKQMDFIYQENILKAYGQLLVDAYQDLLQLIARSHAISDEISVSGLDDFSTDNITDLIANIKELIGIDLNVLRSQLPPTAFSIVYSKLINLLLGNLSPDQQRAIEQELAAMADVPPTPPANSTNIN